MDTRRGSALSQSDTLSNYLYVLPTKDLSGGSLHRTNRILRQLLTAIYCVLPACSGVSYDICLTSNLTPGGVGSRGNITSPLYPANAPDQGRTSPTCRLSITACSNCRIRVTYEDIVLPNCRVTKVPVGSCVHQCDHLFLFEPGYPETTAQYVFGDSTSLHSYTTVSSRLNIIFCHSIANPGRKKLFQLGYEIQNKYTVIEGKVGGPNESGYFTSPNFPHSYSLRNEKYTFLIQNSDPSGLIRLGFDDWNMSPNSAITIYFSNTTHPDGYLTRKGQGDRPFVLSSGPSLFVTFETGEDLYAIPYVGFKAKYQFVSEPFWPDKPYTVCGKYFYSHFGGQFSFDTRRCWPGDRVDCIWVVTRYRDHNHDHVSLSVQMFYVVPGLDSLEIRAGNTSEGRLLGEYDHSNLTGTEFVTETGFYLRLRATCSNARQFHAVFTSFTNATDGGCEYYNHHLCANNRCISRSLLCDGTDHCGDGSDETGCTTLGPTTTKVCGTNYVCRSGKELYCFSDKCDGKWDCDDGTDERDCWITDRPWPTPATSYSHWGTYIPIGLVSILLAIISCIVISCCARRKRNLLRRRQRAMANGRLPTISATLPGRQHRSALENQLSFNVSIHHYPDAPPPYDEAILPPSYDGIYNMGYSRSDSSDPLPHPPPYTPRDQLAYPMMPQVIGNPGAEGLSSPPSGPQYAVPQPPVPASPQISLTQLAITGTADLGSRGPETLPEGSNHSANTNVDHAESASRHQRDPNRRRGRNHATMGSGSRPGNNRHGSRRRDVTSGGTCRSPYNKEPGHVSREHSRPSGRSRSSRHSETPPEPGPHARRSSNQDTMEPAGERRPSSSTAHVQAFVQNLINMAAYRTGIQQPGDGVGERGQPGPPSHPPPAQRGRDGHHGEDMILSEPLPSSPVGDRSSEPDLHTSTPTRRANSPHAEHQTLGQNEQDTRRVQPAYSTASVDKDSLGTPSVSQTNPPNHSSNKSTPSKSDKSGGQDDDDHSGSHLNNLPNKKDSQNTVSNGSDSTGDHGNADPRSVCPPGGSISSSNSPVVNLDGADDSMTFV